MGKASRQPPEPGIVATVRTGERGSGTVLSLSLIAVVLVVGAALGVLGSAQAARGRAQTAADLGALAGASAVASGWDGCSRSQATVLRNGGRMVSCVVESPGIVQVRVACRPSAVAGVVLREAYADARAGPGEYATVKVWSPRGVA